MYIHSTLTHIANWPANHPAELGLLAAVITAAAVALTVLDRVHATDEHLDRLGSAIPGQPASDLDTWALNWREQVENHDFPDLVDVDTAITVIRTGAL